MPDIPNRRELERLIGDEVNTLLVAWREDLARKLGPRPDPALLTPAVWAGYERQLTVLLFVALRPVYRNAAAGLLAGGLGVAPKGFIRKDGLGMSEGIGSDGGHAVPPEIGPHGLWAYDCPVRLIRIKEPHASHSVMSYQDRPAGNPAVHGLRLPARQ